MGDALTARSGIRVQEVSRQFTGPERAIDERITDHLTSPMPQMENVPMTVGYKWLEDDLKMRSQVTAVLGQERALADAQSVRHEMDRKFRDDAADEAYTIEATKKVNEMLKTDPSLGYKGAYSKFVSENPDAMSNPRFLQSVKEAQTLFESDTERQARLAELEAANAKNQLAGFSAKQAYQFASDPENAALAERIHRQTLLKEANGFELDEKDLEIRKVVQERQLMQAQADLETLKTSGQPGSFQSGAVAAGFFKRAGIVPRSLDKAAEFLRGNEDVAKMIVHPEFLRTRMANPADAQLFTKAFDTMLDESAPQADRDAAKSLVQETYGEFLQATRDTEFRLEQRKKLDAIGSKLGGSMQTFREKMADFRKIPLDKKKAPGVPAGEAAVEYGASWMKEIAAEFPEARPLMEEAQKELQAIREKKVDASDPAQGSRIYAIESVVEDFAMKFAAQREKAILPQDKSAASPPADAGKKIATPQIAQQYLARAGGDKAKAAAAMKADGYTR